MLTVLGLFSAGFIVGIGGTLCYIRGKLMERWYVTHEIVENGYNIILKKDSQEIVCFRVLFDRPSSPNPDTTFVDQLIQARAEAMQRADSLNGHERLVRENNRRRGTPGGIT